MLDNKTQSNGPKRYVLEMELLLYDQIISISKIMYLPSTFCSGFCKGDLPYVHFNLFTIYHLSEIIILTANAMLNSTLAT